MTIRLEDGTRRPRKAVAVVSVRSEEPMTDLRRWVRQYVEAIAAAEGIALTDRVKAA